MTKFCQKLENMTVSIVVEGEENLGLSNIATFCVNRSTPFKEQLLEELLIWMC